MNVQQSSEKKQADTEPKVYQDNGVRPFADVQSRLPIGVDVVFGNEPMSREAKEHARGTTLPHFIT